MRQKLLSTIRGQNKLLLLDLDLMVSSLWLQGDISMLSYLIYDWIKQVKTIYKLQSEVLFIFIYLIIMTKTYQMATIKARQTIEFIKEKEKEYDFQDTVVSYIDYSELQEAIDNDTVYDFLNDLNDDRRFTDTEIIYYSNAIKYLQENDPSMQEAIEISSDYWYETKNLDSELLASLLATRNNEEDYSKFIDEVVEFVNDLE